MLLNIYSTIGVIMLLQLKYKDDLIKSVWIAQHTCNLWIQSIQNYSAVR